MSVLTTEEKLDEALRQTFPASDAFSLTPTGEEPNPGSSGHDPDPNRGQSPISR